MVHRDFSSVKLVLRYRLKCTGSCTNSCTAKYSAKDTPEEALLAQNGDLVLLSLLESNYFS